MQAVKVAWYCLVKSMARIAMVVGSNTARVKVFGFIYS